MIAPVLLLFLLLSFVASSSPSADECNSTNANDDAVDYIVVGAGGSGIQQSSIGKPRRYHDSAGRVDVGDTLTDGRRSIIVGAAETCDFAFIF